MAQTASNMVQVLDPDGKPGTIPAEQLDDAIAQGYSQPGGDGESTGEQLATGAEGVLHGFVPGGPSLEATVAPEMGSLAAQKARKEKYPGTYGTGQAIGAGLQGAAIGAVTGGLGDVAELGARASTVGKVLEGAEPVEAMAGAEATPEAIAGAVKTAATQAPQTAKAVTEAAYGTQAAAGAAGGATNYINESELGDHEFNGQALAIETGLFGILGAAGEGAGNLMRETIAPKIISKASDALDSLGAKAGKAFYKASDVVNSLEPGMTEAAGKAISAGAKKASEKAIDSLADQFGDVRDQMDTAEDKLWDEYHAGEAKNLLKDKVTSEVQQPLQSMRDQLSSNVDTIEQKLESYRNDNVPVGQARNGVSIARRAIKDLGDVVDDETKSPFEMQRAVVTARRAIDTGAAWDKNLLPGVEKDLLSELRDTVRSPLKNILNSEDLWGPEMAARNSAINDSFVKSLNSDKNVLGDIGKKEWVEGQKQAYIDPAKLRTVVNGDPLAAQQKLLHIHDWISDAKDRLAQIKISAGNAGKILPGGEDLEALLNTVTANTRAAAAYQPVTSLQRGLASQPRWGMGAAGAAPLTGLGLAHVGAGIPGIAAGVAGVAALRSPIKAMQMFAMVSGAAKRAKDVISSGVNGLLSNPVGRTAVTAATASALRGLSAPRVPGVSRDASTFQKQAHNISRLTANVQAQMDNSRENTSRLNDVAPLTAMSVIGSSTRGAQVLNAALPRNPAPSMIASENKEWHPDATTEAAWNDLHAAILKPPTFLKAVQNGTATPETWAALQSVYPGWTKQVQQELTQQLIAKPKLDLSVGQKAAISMILGQSVSPTVAPDQVQFQQGIYAAPEAPAGGSPKMRSKGLDKIMLGDRTAPGHQRTR